MSFKDIEDSIRNFRDVAEAPGLRARVMELLDMQRHGMLIYTSCGWFFDDISGIETIQIMQYAARAMQLAGERACADLERDFVRILEQAPSNAPEWRDGAHVFEARVKPAMRGRP